MFPADDEESQLRISTGLNRSAEILRSLKRRCRSVSTRSLRMTPG